MRKHILISIFLAFYVLGLNAQEPQKPSTADIYLSLQKLNFLGSVLYVAAHPDDENTRLISYMSNGEKARTAYLSMTRGDGGQNLIGPEIRELLGIIRTQELLAARRIDGGEQFFTRANDFGFSKEPDETLAIWNKDKVLSDVVLAIRRFKPDVIINRFDHRTPGTTHGHHTSSAMLSMEAFDLANKKNAYPDQLKQVSVWQPKRIFYNTSPWAFRNSEDFENMDKSNLVTFNVGEYYPLKGLSNNEIAALASSQHLSQGFGRLTDRGAQEEYLEFLKGEPLTNNSTVFDGIDTSWNRIKGGKAIGDILYKIEENFNFKDPSVHLADLMKAFQLLQNIEDGHWKAIKTKALKSIIEACVGLYLEASAANSNSTPNNNITINIEAINRSNAAVELVSLSQTDGTTLPQNIALKPNRKENIKTSYTLSNQAPYTTPYWLNEKGTLGMYSVGNEQLIGLPETPRQVAVDFNLNINNIPISFTKNVIYRYAKPDKGELYRPFEIVPEASSSIKEKVIIFEDDKPKSIEVTVKAGRNNLKGYVEISHPNDWIVSPEKQDVNIANAGEELTFTFTITPPKNQSEGFMSPIVHVNGKTYKKELVEIDYGHIPFQTVLLPNDSKVVRLDIKKKGENIAYIAGAGDVVPESLQQIGYNVSIINPETITAEMLNGFDAVVVGIRAYNTVDALKFKQPLLFEYVKNGGNMIVQYNTNSRLTVDNLAPYTLKLSRDRVTDENAKVTFLNPNNPLLNYPNKITEKDFEGWTQERGLYFPGEWADEFTPILSMHDKGETPKNGSLLVAKYGKGHYIYTGLSFFREFPEGVSGAYRLFANMLSIGKEDVKQNASLKN